MVGALLGPPQRAVFGPSRAAALGGVHLGPEYLDNTQPYVLTPEQIITSQELDPLITLYFGRRGDGKTWTMTTTLAMMLKSYIKNGRRYSRRRPDGFKIIANYHVRFADFCNPMVVQMLNDYDERFRHCIMAIDEILSYVPSRRTMSRTNLDFANQLVQIRKLDMEMIGTTQKPQNIDGQMLDQIDLFILPMLYNYQWVPRREQWSGKLTGKMWYKPTSVHLLIWDWWGTYTGKQWSKRWPPQMSGEPPDWETDFHGIDQIMHLFSTKEQVPSVWHQKAGDVVAREWAADLEQMAAHYAPEIAEEEEEGQKPATLASFIAAQPDDIMVSSIFEEARAFDKGLKHTRDLAARMEEEGFMIVREGRYGYRALRLEGE